MRTPLKLYAVLSRTAREEWKPDDVRMEFDPAEDVYTSRTAAEMVRAERGRDRLGGADDWRVVPYEAREES